MEKSRPVSLSGWQPDITALQYSLTNHCLLYISLLLYFLVSPDFRSDIFGPTKIWLRDLQRLWAIFLCTGKLLGHVGACLGRRVLR